MFGTSVESVQQFLKTQIDLDILRFITCGSVDDGKSTLLGRMLYEARLIFEDQLASLQSDSKAYGTQGNEIDFALLVDGLASEREQGITIDVAYRFFATERRKFVVADTPGHEQYTRNMVTGASTANAAIILIDARRGILPQTRRHSIICSTLGIRHVLLAVNKMDLVDFESQVFEDIVADYLTFAESLKFDSITSIPISALKGDNVVDHSTNMPWFKGISILKSLENLPNQSNLERHPLRYPVQWVNRPNLDFRGFSGTVEAGVLRQTMAVRILPSGELASIKEIILSEESMKTAETGRSVTLTLDREVDVSRGDVIVDADSPCEIADHFEADLFWLDGEPGFSFRGYLMQIATTEVGAQISDIKYRIEINTLNKVSTKKLAMNDLVVVTIKTDRKIPFDSYQECCPMGSFTLVDRISNKTLAAGMIRHALRRSTNIHAQLLDIDKSARQKLNGHKSKVLWFTGFSGSGKSTIANALEIRLHGQGVRTYLLDGDNVRHHLNSDLGFTDADRIENIRRIAELSRLMVDAGLVVLTAFISPFRSERDLARQLVGEDEFVEIFVDVPLAVAEERDPKGLYKKARSGDIPNFTGIGSAYEKPVAPEICLKAAEKTVDELVNQILDRVKF